MNKITKLLSVFIIAGAIGTGVAGAVGCGGKGDDGGEKGHTHGNYTYTQIAGNDEQHNKKCGNDGHTGNATELEDHRWVGNECADCHYPKPAEGGNVTSVTVTTPAQTIYIGKTLTLEATVEADTGVSTDVTWQFALPTEYATLDGNVLTAVSKGSVYVVAVSVANTSKKSEPVEIKIAESNIFSDLIADTENNIIGDDFQTTSELPVYTGYENTTPGIYQWGDGNDIAAAGHGVSIVDGKAVHTVPQAGGTTNVSLVADLTGGIKDVVEGYAEISVDAVGGNWAVMALTGKAAGVESTGEVFALRMEDNTGKMGYRVGGKDNGKIVNSDTLKLDATNGTVYKVHFVLDMVSGLINVDVAPVGGTRVILAENVQTNITELKAVTFVSSNGGKRHTTIDNLAVNSTALTLEEAKVSLGKKVDSYVDAATADDTLTLTGGTLDTAVASVKGSINTAGSVAEAKAIAYTDIDSAILANAKTSAKDLIDGISSTGYTGEALDDLNAAKAKAKSDIDAATVTTVAAVKEAYAKGKEDVEAVEDDEARTQIDVNVTFTCTAASGIDGTLSKKDGETITLAEVRANAKGVAANKIITGIKVDGAAAALPYTLHAVDNATTNIDIEVVLSDYANLTATADCGVPASAGTTDVTGLGTEGFFTVTGAEKSATDTKQQQGKLQNITSGVEGTDKYTKQIGLTSGKVGKYKDDHIANSIKFTVESACTVTVVCAAPGKEITVSVLNDSDASNATITNLKKNGESLVDEEGKPAFDNVATDKVVTYEFTLEAGTYHVGGSGGGLLVYEISVIYTKPAQA